MSDIKDENKPDGESPTENLVEENVRETEGFPDAKEITNLLGDSFSMPTITTENEEAAPSAEPEPIEDPDSGESYIADEDGNVPRPDAEPTEDGEKDAKGRIFDPQLYATDANGNPKRNKKDYFIFLRKDKRGTIDTEAPRKSEFYETGLLYFDGATDTLAAILGDHWKPSNDEQRKSMGRTVGKYLESEDAPTLSPKQELLLKSATYSAPRITHVDTFDNARLLLSRSYLGIKSFWQTITGKKPPKHSPPETRPQAEEITEDAPVPNVDLPASN